jgi:Ni,Fe-hydrogenase I large subunit
MSVDSLFEMEIPCRVCGCTDSMGCAEGCSWVKAKRAKGREVEVGPICSVCEDLVREAEKMINRTNGLVGVVFADLVDRLERRQLVEDGGAARMGRAVLDVLLRNGQMRIMPAPAKKRGGR